MEEIVKNKQKNIVIIGGSASGFSCAWMMLNGPALYNRNNSLGSTDEKFPGAERKTISDCLDCCVCPPQRKLGSIKCLCSCKCFGQFSENAWKFKPELLATHLGPGSIKILYRDQIKVFYQSVKQAKADGYDEFDSKLFTRQNGFVYSYTGLRGNAKTLYRRIKSGAENRVQLVKARTVSEQAKHLKDADIVIWACGYETNKIPIKNGNGQEISL